MKFGKLSEITGKTVRSWYEWLDKEGNGCSSLCYQSDDKYNYAVCMGWHDLGDVPKEKNYSHWVIAWKIGRQTRNNVMQCEFDIDFEMPYNEDGDLDDTLETIERKVVKHGCIGHPRMGAPVGYKSWDELARQMRKTARRIWDTWKEVSDE